MRGCRAVFVLLLSFLVSVPVVRAQDPLISADPSRWVYGQKLNVTGVPNAGKITDQLYRGAQPRRGGIQELKKFGITTIVDLRGENAAEREREKKEAEALGIHFISIPVSEFAPPSREQVTEFLSLFSSDDPTKKVFVHCHFGEDRTGVFVATYRMAMQKWPADEAIKEMYFFGFNGFWHPAMSTYVRKFPTLMSSGTINAKPATVAAQPN